MRKKLSAMVALGLLLGLWLVSAEVYIEDDPDYVPPSENAAKERVDASLSIPIIRFNMPYLGSERWGELVLGSGLEWTPEHQVDQLVPYSIGFEYAFSSLGFYNDAGTGHFIKLAFQGILNDNWTLKTSIYGLITATPWSYLELGTALTYIENATLAPWKGFWAKLDLVPGFDERSAWLDSRLSAMYILQLVDESLVLIPAVSFVNLFGDAPDLRLPSMIAGFGMLPDELGSGLPNVNSIMLSSVSGILRIKGNIPLTTISDTESGNSKLLLGISLGIWGAAENGLRSSERFPVQWKSGLVLSSGLVIKQSSILSGHVTERIQQILSIELSVPFDGMATLSAYQVRLLSTLDPAQLIRF